MKGLGKNSLRFFILLSCLAVAFAARSFVIEFESFHPEWNKSIFDTFTIKMLQDGRRQVFNGTVINAIPIYQNDINLVIWLVRKNGRNRKVIDFTVDGCKFLSNSLGSSTQAAFVFMKVLRSTYKNIPPSCPIKKGYEYVLDKLYLDPEQFPPFLPEVSFEVQISMKYRDIIGYKVKLLGAVISKEKRNH